MIDGFDRTVLGNTLPEIYGAWNNSFSYKGIELDIIAQYSYGNEVFNATNTRLASFHGGDQNQSTSWLERWTPQTPNNTQYAGVPSLRPADYLVEDGSFIRLQTVKIGYNLPLKWITPARIKSAKANKTPSRRTGLPNNVLDIGANSMAPIANSAAPLK